MPKKKNIENEIELESQIEVSEDTDNIETISILQMRVNFLDDLYKTLKSEGINSISDLENKLAWASRELEQELNK